jgi:hypothetical protein
VSGCAYTSLQVLATAQICSNLKRTEGLIFTYKVKTTDLELFTKNIRCHPTNAGRVLHKHTQHISGDRALHGRFHGFVPGPELRTPPACPACPEPREPSAVLGVLAKSICSTLGGAAEPQDVPVIGHPSSNHIPKSRRRARPAASRQQLGRMQMVALAAFPPLAVTGCATWDSYFNLSPCSSAAFVALCP